MEIRARLGYMPETDGHIPGMNAVSFVAYCGQLAGLPAVDAMQRAHEVLYYVGLGEARYRNLETYSTGMKQRIKLAQAIVHDPDLLFLDEPTNGMDPKGRDEMLELIRDLGHNKGVSLILSSHLLPDVEYTCDHVVVMDKGQVAAQGPIDELKGPAGRVFELRVKVAAGSLPGFIDVLQKAGMECHSTDEDVMRVFVPTGVGGSERTRPADSLLARGQGGRAGPAPAPERADARGRLRESGRGGIDAYPRPKLPPLRGRESSAGPRLAGHRQGRDHAHDPQAAVPRPADRVLGAVPLSRRPDLLLDQFPPDGDARRHRRDLPRVPRAAESRSSSS